MGVVSILLDEDPSAYIPRMKTDITPDQRRQLEDMLSYLGKLVARDGTADTIRMVEKRIGGILGREADLIGTDLYFYLDKEVDVDRRTELYLMGKGHLIKAIEELLAS